jgi:hypothetical protein
LDSSDFDWETNGVNWLFWGSGREKSMIKGAGSGIFNVEEGKARPRDAGRAIEGAGDYFFGPN